MGKRESRVCNNNSAQIKPSKEVNILNQEARHPTETPKSGETTGKAHLGRSDPSQAWRGEEERSGQLTKPLHAPLSLPGDASFWGVFL